MKTTRTLCAAAALLALSFAVSSCGELEPSTYYEQFYRIGTVVLDGDKASISFDYTGESYTIKDFQTKSDMEKYGLQPGDRVMMSLDFNATGTMYNSEITISKIKKFETRKFETTKPADTLNYYFQFTKFAFYNVTYPVIWSTGHLVNVAPITFVPENNETTEYYLAPVSFENDTLFTRLYSYIPGCDISLNPDYTQSLLCYDLSSLRERSADAVNQAIRDTILARLERMPVDTFTFVIMTPDTLRANNSKADTTYLQPIANLSKAVAVPFDF